MSRAALNPDVRSERCSLREFFCDFSPSKQRMQKVSNISIFVMYSMYFLAALFGYLTFKGEAGCSEKREIS